MLSADMCRLFAMTAGPRAVTATFWRLEAPDSLAVQSRAEPGGTRRHPGAAASPRPAAR